MDARLYLCAPAVSGDKLRAALRGGVDILQLRDETLGDAELLRAAKTFRALAHRAGALFVLNDRPDLALECGADGVHLGQGDATPAEARGVLGPDAIIGRSTHDPAQGAAAAADPEVTYLSVGPVWATPTKPGRPAAGLDYVRWAAAHVEKPWFAIGGIGLSNVHEVVEAGARRIVVVRALLGAGNGAARAKALKEAIGDGFA